MGNGRHSLAVRRTRGEYRGGAQASEHTAKTDVGVKAPGGIGVTGETVIEIKQMGFGCAGSGAGPRLATPYHLFTGRAVKAGTIACPAHSYKGESCTTTYGGYGSQKSCKTVDMFGDNRSMSFAAGQVIFSYSYAAGGAVDLCASTLQAPDGKWLFRGTPTGAYSTPLAVTESYAQEVQQRYLKYYSGCTTLPSLSFN